MERDLKGQEGKGWVVANACPSGEKTRARMERGMGWRQPGGEALGSGVRGQAVYVILVSFPSTTFLNIANNTEMLREKCLLL